MIDFAQLVTAAEPGLGWKSETFLTAYMAGLEDANRDSTDLNPVAQAIVSFMDDKLEAEYSPTELLKKLRATAATEYATDASVK